MRRRLRRSGFRLGMYLFRDAEILDFAAPYGVFSENVVWSWWQPEPVSRNRDEVRRVIEEPVARGRWGHPEVVAEVGDRVVVDPRPEPPVEFAPQIRHVYTFREGWIVRREDYPDRESALAAVWVR